MSLTRIFCCLLTVVMTETALGQVRIAIQPAPAPAPFPSPSPSPSPTPPPTAHQDIVCQEFFQKPKTYCADMTVGMKEDFPQESGLFWDDKYQRVDGCCNDTARIKIIPPCWARALRIDTTAVDSAGWTFNLGDSVTNDGWGGDAGTTTFDAEVQILNGWFRTYVNDHCRPGLSEHPSFLSYVGPSHSMTLKVTKWGLQRFSVPTGNNFKQVCWDKCLFDWSEMYLGINRVVRSGSSRTGSGLCKVCFTWEVKSFCKYKYQNNYIGNL